jgi:hypothetical protein
MSYQPCKGSHKEHTELWEEYHKTGNKYPCAFERLVGANATDIQTSQERQC